MSLTRVFAFSLLFTSACIHFPSYPSLVTSAGSGRTLFHDVSVFTAIRTDLLLHQDHVRSVKNARKYSSLGAGAKFEKLA
jgi:hypothetical protein